MFHKRWDNERGDAFLIIIAIALLILLAIYGPAMCSLGKEQKETNEKLGELSTRMTRIESEQTRQGQQLDFIVEITEKIWGAVKFLRNMELIQILGGLCAFVGVYLLFRRRSYA